MILLRFIRLVRLNLSPSYESYENPGSNKLPFPLGNIARYIVFTV